MKSLGSIAASLCLAMAVCACEAASSGVPAGASDTTSDLAVGGGDADVAPDADAAPGTDAAIDSAADAVTDATAGTDASSGTDGATGSDVAADASADTADALADSATTDASTDAATTDAGKPAVPAGGCTKEVSCDKLPGAYCLAPGAFGGCGMCMKVEGPGCKSDAECSGTPNGICELQYDNCLCEKIPQCYEGCVKDADCDEGLICGADHHCKVKTCAANSDCPGPFVCSAGACARKPCSASQECPAYCVNGFCYSQAGTCDLPKP